MIYLFIQCKLIKNVYLSNPDKEIIFDKLIKTAYQAVFFGTKFDINMNNLKLYTEASLKDLKNSR